MTRFADILARDKYAIFCRTFTTRNGIVIRVTVNRFGVNSWLTDANGIYVGNNTRKTRHEAVSTLFTQYRAKIGAQPVQYRQLRLW